MKSYAIIGANYGDEGKGQMTAFFANRVKDSCVVRFNGGAQAGHTVRNPYNENKPHIFSHFGSGTFDYAPTFLTQDFIVNPVMFEAELLEIEKNHGFDYSRVYVDPRASVTLPFDISLNRAKELARGGDRHGSCGLGINETRQREINTGMKVQVCDLIMRRHSLRDLLLAYYEKYYKALEEDNFEIDIYDEEMVEQWIESVHTFLNEVRFLRPEMISRICDNVIFEGAQGLLLDQDNKDNFPYVTHSKTGTHNIRRLIDEMGIAPPTVIYASRWYMTQHGVGPFPTECPSMFFMDTTNVTNKWQGNLRFGHLNVDELLARCQEDAGDWHWNIALTCCDQGDSSEVVKKMMESGRLRYLSTSPNYIEVTTISD